MEDAPTEFELVTAVAMEFFKRSGCDIVVLETGMGGRLDSTNVITSPLCSLITNIGLDHTRELGDSLEKITLEKAGIIKEGRPTVIYSLPANLREIIALRCKELSSPLYTADFSQIHTEKTSLYGQEFSYKNHKNLFLPLLGAHQIKNAALVIDCLEVLSSLGFSVSDSAIRQGLKKTRWPARFELLREEPFFILDGGHNAQCAETVGENLSAYFPNKKAVMLIGVLEDKDYLSLANILLPHASAFVTIAPESPRALPAKELANKLSPLGLAVFPCESIELGIKKSLELAGDKGLVCAVGSLYSAGKIREFFIK
jgi:dihydrofolate synthase/folylpolyglutamate synthase